MPRHNSSYEHTKDKVKSNYGTCAQIAAAPLAASFLLFATAHSKVHTVGMTGSIPLGIASLFITIPLTAITIPAGLIGAAVNSVYGAVALPIAAALDAKDTEENTDDQMTHHVPTAQKENSSTQQMLQVMPSVNTENPMPVENPILERPRTPLLFQGPQLDQKQLDDEPSQEAAFVH